MGYVLRSISSHMGAAMIEKIRIRGYRKFRDVEIRPRPGLNIVVGNNESGKSTLLEALGLALNGRINGRSAQEELNPYWFNKSIVDAFFASRAAGAKVAPPSILIELYLEDIDALQRLHGAINSSIETMACPGVSIRIEPNPDYSDEIDLHFASGSQIVPVEYYRVDWRSFADQVLTSRPKELMASTIDSRTVRSSSGVDYHLRQILGDHLGPREKADISLAYRTVKEQMTDNALKSINDKMAQIDGPLAGATLGLAMDQSSRTSWEMSVVPHVADVPFSMAGQGQQAAVKIALAMERTSDSASVVLIEEPENHLSHTSLNKLVGRIEAFAKVQNQQLFITTHSSFVLNRLGLDGLLLMHDGVVARFDQLHADTVRYFQKLPGYDTLRLVLADKLVLVEGPSDEILFERFYLDKYGVRPIEHGVDVLSMRGLSLRRCLAVCAALDKHCVAMRDVDDLVPDDIEEDLSEYLDDDKRRLFVGDPTKGVTLEPQVRSENSPEVLRKVLGIQDRADLPTWMKNNKTEGALRIAESGSSIEPPLYLAEAVEFVHGK